MNAQIALGIIAAIEARRRAERQAAQPPADHEETPTEPAAEPSQDELGTSAA
ncbi:hypothetical protein [Nonomuraea sp. KM90]|uniref:hypothetical protein n=1 Tax=Nonomuraea sp. KM90 TaxID=3457428 RepID=UPI003FCDCE86